MQPWERWDAQQHGAHAPGPAPAPAGAFPFLGTYEKGYWADPYTLFWVEVIAMQFAELRRWQVRAGGRGGGGG